MPTYRLTGSARQLTELLPSGPPCQAGPHYSFGMAIRQLTPTIRKLGALRLCRDDVAEILVQIRKLDNVTITIEADHSELDDLETDLPKLGKRLKYLTIKAVRSRSTSFAGIPTVTTSPSVVELDPPLEDVLTVKLAVTGCQIEATDPDPTTRGIISSIEDLAKSRRRVPRRFPNLFSGPADAAQFWWTMLFALAFAAGAVILLLHNNITLSGHPSHSLPKPAGLAIGIVAGLMVLFTVVSSTLSRTLLLTATSAEAPTFWKQNGMNIIIGVLIAAVFYLLGLTT
jgi:hypothetical protein